MDPQSPNLSNPSAQQPAASAQVQGDDPSRDRPAYSRWCDDPRIAKFLNENNLSAGHLEFLLLVCQDDWNRYEASVQNLVSYAGNEDLLILLSSQAPRLIRTLKIEELINYLMRTDKLENCNVTRG